MTALKPFYILFGAIVIVVFTLASVPWMFASMGADFWDRETSDRIVKSSPLWWLMDRRGM